jgi:hypothetical protein
VFAPEPSIDVLPVNASDVLIAALHPLTGNPYVHFVFVGAFVVGLWTYLHRFIVQLLLSDPDSAGTIVPRACAKFDVDLASPRFPDSIPRLLSRSSLANRAEVASLERDRLLIAFLLFTRMCDVSSHFDDFEWQQVLQRRYTTLLATLETYEVALGCPGLPTPRADPHAMHLWH